MNRHVKTFDGAYAGMEKNLYKAVWDGDGKRIAAGGGDRVVSLWEVRTGKLLGRLPGHKGAVNDVRFSPTEPSLSKFRSFLLHDMLLTAPHSSFCFH